MLCLLKKICLPKIEFEKRWEAIKYLIITQDNLIKQVADREDLDMATVRDIFKTAEEIIFDHLSSASPSNDAKVRLLNGLCLESKYIPQKMCSRGIFRNVIIDAHLNIKATVSKHYRNKINNLTKS